MIDLKENYEIEEVNYEEMIKSKIIEIDPPLLLYFTKGERGPVSRLHRNGKVVFPHRSCSLETGFALISKIHHHEKFAFIEGENIKSLSLNKETLKSLFFQNIEEEFVLKTAITCDGIEGFIKESIHGEHFCFIDSNYNIRSFSAESMISPRKERYFESIQTWEKGNEIFVEELQELRKKYDFSKFKPVSYLKYIQMLDHLLNLNPILHPFSYYLRNGTVSFIDLLQSATPHQYEAIHKNFDKNYLHKSPLMLTSLNHNMDTKEQQELYESIYKYNSMVAKWWSIFGINEFSNIFQEIIQQELIHLSSK